MRLVIDFSALERAKPYDGPIWFKREQISADSLVHKRPDDVIAIVNTNAQKGNLLPFSFWHQVIKKHSDKRFGILADAERLYEFILKKYEESIFRLDLEDARNIHNEMMLVYIRRTDIREDIMPHLDRICRSYLHTWTENNILYYFNTKKDYENTIKLFHEWPPQLEKDSWTYEQYLTAVKFHSPEIFDSRCDDLITENRAIANQIASFLFKYRFNLDESLRYYEALSVEERNDRNAREILKQFLTAERIDEAIEFFNHWPSRPTAHTFNCLISHLFPINPLLAIDMFARAYKSAEAYQKSIELSISSFTINLHYTEAMGGGTPLYSVFPFPVIEAMLGFFQQQLVPQKAKEHSWKPNRTIELKIITGKGKEFELRRKMADYIQDNFGWDSSPDEGCLIVRRALAKFSPSPAIQP